MSYSVIVFGSTLFATLSAGANGPECSIITIRPCPNKPNCVSSMAPDGARSMSLSIAKGLLRTPEKGCQALY